VRVTTDRKKKRMPMSHDLLSLGERHLRHTLMRYAEADREDLAQDARLALHDARSRYEERAGGASSITYAKRVIERALVQATARRRRRAGAPTVSLEELTRGEGGEAADLPDPAAVDPARAALAAAARVLLDAAVRGLPWRQQTVVRDCYGWDGGEPRSLAACARGRGLTTSQARTALTGAHATLRAACEEAGWSVEELLVALAEEGGR